MPNEQAVAVWMRDESLRPLMGRLTPAALTPRVVSFDFFDTLLFRLCAQPADLFVEVGRQFERQGLLRIPMSPSEFKSVRLAADEKARRKRQLQHKLPEVALSDIYAELHDVVADPLAARALEFSIERSLSYVNPAMLSLVEHVRTLGCRTAIVSDTYFTAEELLLLLQDHDVSPALFDAVLVSCELGKAKWFRGSLYHELLKRFEAHPGEVLHIGDSIEADVHQARLLGIDTNYYYRRTPPLSAALSGEEKLGGGAVSVGSLETVRVLSARRANGSEDPFRDGAFVLGPVLSRFADWCVDTYTRAGVRRVLALMREGELLGELLERSAAARGVSFEIVACYASRLATARAALPAVDRQSVLALLEGATLLAPQGILEILGLAAEGAAFLDEASRLTPLPSHAVRLKFLDALFKLPRIRELVQLRHHESHQLAFDYLRALVGEEPTVGLLDLGWNGSIQHNIARILQRGGRPIRTVGCYLACTKRAGRLALEGQAAHAYLHAEWKRDASLIEDCVTACMGTTRGYTRDTAGRIEPVLEVDRHTPEQRLAKERVREGVLAFQELWLTLYRRATERAWSSDVLADIDQRSQSILLRWMDFPTKQEADRLGLLYHDEDYFGTVGSAQACNAESRALLRRDGVGALLKTEGCYWPQGVMAQVHPRLVSALREHWDAPMALGRLGAYAGAANDDSGLTSDEASALERLLGHFAPEQIIYCGPRLPEIAALTRWRSAVPNAAVPRAAARLILAGLGPPDLVNDAPDSTVRGWREACSVVPGGLDAPATLSAIRAAILPEVSVALILSGDVSPDETRSLLHGLTPFLGPRGIVMIACGRYDARTMHLDDPLFPIVTAWLDTAGADLGFGRWHDQRQDPAEPGNWTILLHAPEAMVFSRQWMPIATDLADGSPMPPHDSPVNPDPRDVLGAPGSTSLLAASGDA